MWSLEAKLRTVTEHPIQEIFELRVLEKQQQNFLTNLTWVSGIHVVLKILTRLENLSARIEPSSASENQYSLLLSGIFVWYGWQA